MIDDTLGPEFHKVGMLLDSWIVRNPIFLPLPSINGRFDEIPLGTVQHLRATNSEKATR